MTGLSIPPYQPGELLKASTVNALIRSIGGTPSEGASGHGINTTVESAKNTQIIAHNVPAGLLSHSVLYYRSSDQTWHGERVAGSIPCTNSNRVPHGGKLAATPLRQGEKYILRGNLPNGTGAQWSGTQLVPAEDDQTEFVVIAEPLNGRYCRVLYKGIAEGTVPSAPSSSEPICSIIEPVRCPPFYDPDITPNPLAVTPTGFFFGSEIEKYENGFLAFMSMGLIAVPGKDYTPLQATYIGGEEYRDDMGAVQWRKRGELRSDEHGNPLYLMRRELVTAANKCTVRRGKDTSYPFKWQYTDKTLFSSGTNNLGNEMYNDFLYGTSFPQAALTDDSAVAEGNPVRYRDLYEMKPYYLKNYSGDSEGGVSPQRWRLTTDREKAQLNYDFAYCPDLEWAETLVPNEQVHCTERQAVYDVPAVDEYNRPLYEYERDQDGNIKLDGDGNPILAFDQSGNMIRAKIPVTFTYYELTPPKEYRSAIAGQPAVDLYVSRDDELILSHSVTEDSIVSITPREKMTLYVRHEDIIAPDDELVYARLRTGNAAAEVVNPLAVVSDLLTDRQGHLTKRLRALFYKKDHADRLYPVLFEVERLPYGYCLEVANTKHYYGTDQDQCAPYHLREEYRIVRENRRSGKKGKTLQLVSTKCYKHRLQVPVMVKAKRGAS